jgi:hypothetical protein
MRCVVCSAVIAILAAAMAVSAASPPPVSPDGAAAGGDTTESQSLSTLLGFRRGEGRRYVLGPPEALYDGEIGVWTMHLRELLGDPPEGVFELTHQWQRGDTRRELPIGTIVQVQSEGELRVNTYGFPLELRFTTQRHLSGWGEQTYTVRYRFEDGRFVKHAAMDGQDIEHAVGILPGADVDLSVPLGMYALVPPAVDCSLPMPGDFRATAGSLPPRPTAGSSTSPAAPQTPGRWADNSMCREQLFANPGLISLMLPVLWEEATGEHEYLLLTPAGWFGTTGVGGASQLGSTAGGGGMQVAAGSEFDHQAAVSPRTNSEVEKLRYVERVSVEIGRRTLEAWLFDGIRGLDAVYVDDDGVVLRVDLDMAGWYGLALAGSTVGFDPTQLGERDLWVRLLYPSEY